ncbi:MAG TPA: alpha-galactosidase, partial [Anaerohalosphaeraceae bacterium]|nr:alpha-galactosidase [Anaerohalosphaeraceae bacterium]
MLKKCVLLFVLTAVFSSACFVLAVPETAKLQIENMHTAVVFDNQTKNAAVYSKDAQKTYISSIQFKEALATAHRIDLNDTGFGKGQAIEIVTVSGDRQRLALYDRLPFVFMQSTIHNASAAIKTIPYYAPCVLKLDLQKSPRQLKAHGTAGLTAVDKKSNSGSYAFLSIVDPDTRKGVVAAWLTNERGSGVLFSDIQGTSVILEPRIDYGRLQLQTGQSETLETLLVGWFDDVRLGLEAYAEAVAQKYAIVLPPQPTVYCTWYHAGASNEKDLIQNAAFAKEHLAPFGFSVVQIDDKWQDGKSTNGPRKNFTQVQPNGPYKSGMKTAADNIKKLGLTPGIWFMPFAGTFDDPYFADKQYLFAKKDGKPFDTKWGGTCFDLTNPKTQQYVYDIVHRIAHEWGYQYFKMDGLYTGTAARLMYINDKYADDQLGESVLYDPSMTHIQSYRTGLQIVRKAAGRDIFFLGCCIPQNMRSFAPAMGLVDAMRIGPDNKRTWEAMLRGPRYGSKVYFLHRRVWYNDPDPIYVQDDVPLQQAITLCSWVTISGQLNASSTDYTKLPPERLDILKRTMPAHNLTPRPADIFEQEIPRIWLLSDERSGVRRDVIALYNWDDKNTAEIHYPLRKIGLDGEKQYIGFDYWANTFLEPFSGSVKVSLPQAGCSILSVRPVSSNPMLLSTSRHITQGIVDVKEE